ncbi:hypothetical protein STAFG_6183 [Streptomyces afghaniensis 772]|uniref:Uncharacterized protein n=1 Tax=Streptomyces afghaniensis 772 TaxID=1283301 RepID=S4MJJ3_9ACTN|nr:hypothetical protein STAFG_6183 [Streptomyces afghaniensis 772]
MELLSRHTGSVRITVDPRAAEGLAEECQGQPAALMLAAAGSPPVPRRPSPTSPNNCVPKTAKAPR